LSLQEYVVTSPIWQVNLLSVNARIISTVSRSNVGQITFAPSWLERVTQRITNSIAPEKRQSDEEPQRWLSNDVAQGGLTFLRNASNLLPSEPYIYSSREGKLVAEFKGAHGNLTAIVSPNSTILFTSTENGFFEKVLDPNKDKDGSILRDELLTIIKILAGQHVSMERTG
jgi:hypothetical protein